MKIIDIRTQEDCFDGDLQKEVVFDQPIAESFIRHLEKAGSLQYFSDFAKPFFRLDAPEGFVLKGIQGRKTCQLITSKADPEGCMLRVRHIVESFSARPAKSISADGQ